MDPSDLTPFAVIDEVKAAAMIEDAMALAERLAPCISTPGFLHEKAARAILRGAILRWHESGSGAYTSKQESAGPFAQNQVYDTRQVRKGMFWPSEITGLQDLCKLDESSGAWSYDTYPAAPTLSPLDGFGVQYSILDEEY